MRYSLLLLALFVCFVACKKKHAYMEGYYTYEYCHFREHYRIDTFTQSQGQVYHSEVPDSNRTVFYYVNGHNILHADDADFSYGVTFQADSGVTSFTYQNEQLADHLTVYSSGGGWGSYREMPINKGIISGDKQGDGTWKVSIFITLPQYDESASIGSIGVSTIASREK